MRGVTFALAGLMLSVAAGQALAECACGYPDRAPHPCARCAAQHPHLAAQGDKAAVYQQEAPVTGAYAAPPRTGTQAGETRALGIEGMSIEFPALRLKFPSLRLPALTHFRTGPRMLVDEAVAGYVTEYREEMSFESGAAQQQYGPQQFDKNGGSQQKNAGPDSLPVPPVPQVRSQAMPPDTAESLVRLEAEYRQRLERMEEMEKRLEWQIQRLTELTAALSATAPPPNGLIPATHTADLEQPPVERAPDLAAPAGAVRYRVLPEHPQSPRALKSSP